MKVRVMMLVIAAVCLAAAVMCGGLAAVLLCVVAEWLGIYVIAWTLREMRADGMSDEQEE